MLAHGQDQLDVAFGHAGESRRVAVVVCHGGLVVRLGRRLLYSATGWSEARTRSTDGRPHFPITIRKMHLDIAQ
ncbi:hypothetical protein D3C72_2113790 [compost metagenome]